MRTTSHHIAAAAIFALALASGASPAAGGQLVVVSNSAEIGFARGSVVEEGASVKIPAGQALALIDSNGKGMTVAGPFEGKLSTPQSSGPADPSVVAALQRILISPANMEIGVVRAAGERPQPPNPRLLDLGEDATFCVAPGEKIELWRPNPLKRTTLILTRLSTGGHSDVEWPANQRTVQWPADLPIIDGETYQAAMVGALARPRLHIKVLAFGGSTIADAERLTQADCRKQAITMLESIAASTSRP